MARNSDQEVEELLSQLKHRYTASQVFDRLHDTVYFIKNAASEYVVVNETLVKRCGLKKKSQLLGRTSGDALPAPFGSTFTEQDRQVLDSGAAMIGQLELHVYPTLDIGWCITDKHPLTSRSGRVVGLVGVSRDLGRPDQDATDYRAVAVAVNYARKNLSRQVKVRELEEVSELSRYQLNRRMQVAFGLTIGQWLLKEKIDRAIEQLQESDLPVVEIAHNVGYSDQSAFTRQFRATTGLTPNDLRKLNQ